MFHSTSEHQSIDDSLFKNALFRKVLLKTNGFRIWNTVASEIAHLCYCKYFWVWREAGNRYDNNRQHHPDTLHRG